MVGFRHVSSPPEDGGEGGGGGVSFSCVSAEWWSSISAKKPRNIHVLTRGYGFPSLSWYTVPRENSGPGILEMWDCRRGRQGARGGGGGIVVYSSLCEGKVVGDWVYRLGV